MSSPQLVVAGNLNVDLALGKVAGWPPWGTEVMLQDVDRRAGGIAHAGCALAALGVHVSVSGSIGRDPDGEFLKTWLGRAGVDAELVEEHDGATGLSVSIVRTDGERTFFTYPGALFAEPPEALLDRIDSRPQWVLLSGLMLLPQSPAEGILRAVERLQREGTRVAADVGWDPEGWPAERLAWTREILGQVDLVLVNQSEADALGFAGEKSSSPGQVLAVKQGPGGATIFAKGKTWTVAGVPADAVDTIGAGDVWNAGYLAAHLSGKEAARAALFANQVASQYVAAPPGPNRYPVADPTA